LRHSLSEWRKWIGGGALPAARQNCRDRRHQPPPPIPARRAKAARGCLDGFKRPQRRRPASRPTSSTPSPIAPPAPASPRPAPVSSSSRRTDS